MRTPIRLAGIALAVALAGGCQPPREVTPAAVQLNQARPGAKRLVPLTGVVHAPASLMANNGAGLVSDKAAGVIGNNSGGYVVLAMEPWTPVVGQRVLLLDVAGNPIEGVAAVSTDDRGAFRFEAVPEGAVVQVEVVTPGVVLRALAKSGAEGPVTVDPASMVVTEKLKAEFGGRQGAIAQVPLARFTQLADAVRAELKKGEVKLDFSSQEALLAIYEQVTRKVPQVADDGQALVEETEANLDEAGTAAPTPTPPPAPTDTPEPEAEATVAVPVMEGPAKRLKPAAVTAPSARTDRPVEWAVDGDLNTHWSNLAFDDATSWLQLRFAGPVALERVRVKTGILEPTQTFTIQVSDDGATWTDLKGPLPADSWTMNEHQLSGTARYVRVHFTNSESPPSSRFTLFEITVDGWE